MLNPFKMDIYDLINRANKIKEHYWGKKVFFIKNIHFNYTNICVSHCRFCAFAKDVGEDGSYLYTPNKAVEYIGKNGKEANEIHIVGGLHPDYNIEFYIEMIHALKSNFPKKVIKAFSAVEIDYFAKISDLSVSSILERLNKVGLEMLPGGGAEIFDRQVRNHICPEKISANRWLEIHEIAHKIGITTNATMLYGHLEKDEDRLNHLLKLRELQEKTKGFSAFIPLSFNQSGTFLEGKVFITGLEDIKVIASSRIILDNIPHIKAYWVMLGSKTAQIALKAGADDLDGTIVKENITYAAGGKSEDAMTVNKLTNMIKSAELIPVERDSFYKELTIYG